MSSQPRKQRRAYEKFLKKHDPKAYKEWKSKSAERGKEIHREHLDNIKIAEESSDRQSEIIDYENL
jgi:hypothetical protein